MTHSVTFRIYYEDTDAGGVVYYANYLKFAERARTELLRDKGVSQTTLAAEKNVLFVVRHAELDIEKPAKLDDEIVVTTTIEQLRGASVVMLQHISKEDRLLARVKVRIACINSAFKPTRIPQGLFS